jgi:methyl-accepting chemotaxis protein
VSTKDIKAFDKSVAAAFKSLSDCSALKDLEGFAGELSDLADEANRLSEAQGHTEAGDDEANRLYDLADALREASEAVSEMADFYTEAHQVLARATEV